VGSAFIKSDERVKVVYNNRVKKNSKVIVTLYDNAGGPWWVSNQGDGFFEVSVSSAMGYNIRFNYWIVGVNGGAEPMKPEGYSGGEEAGTPPDATPPEISVVEVVNVSETGATINWTTNEDADSVVKFNPLSSPTPGGQYSGIQSNNNMSLSHSLNLSDLKPDTTYYYIVKSADAAGNGSESQEYSFKTASLVSSLLVPQGGGEEGAASTFNTPPAENTVPPTDNLSSVTPVSNPPAEDNFTSSTANISIE
jgi:hypothetical protein